MMNEHTFEKLLASDIPKDDVLKIIQAEVGLIKTKPKMKNIDKGRIDYEPFAERVANKMCHNGITVHHVNAAVSFSEYQAMTEIGDIGGYGDERMKELFSKAVKTFLERA